MNEQQIAKAEEAILHTYNRFPVTFDRGEGVYLYDTEGKKYLDFYAGIAVSALGYHYPGYDDALKAQIDKLLHTSNLFYNAPAVSAAEKLKKLSGLDRVFFTNSGTEAIEGAIKTARRYAYNKDIAAGREPGYDCEIIAMKSSFHGRSMGSLSVTGNDHYQDPFRPMIGGVKFADFNDIDSVKALVTDKTVAIIMETFQAEGGIYPGTKEFAQAVRKLCDEKDMLLILDEVQCGMGRTGSMFYYQQLGIMPDVLTIAKALGCGVPVGAFLVNEKAATLVPGDHGTTYGGNPFVCAAANQVLDTFEKDGIVANAKEVGAYLYEKLEELAKSSEHIVDHRGVGLLQGLEFDGPVGDISKKALENGLVVISAEHNVIRFLPPLVIKKEHVDEMIEKFKKCI